MILVFILKWSVKLIIILYSKDKSRIYWHPQNAYFRSWGSNFLGKHLKKKKDMLWPGTLYPCLIHEHSFFFYLKRIRTRLLVVIEKCTEFDNVYLTCFGVLDWPSVTDCLLSRVLRLYLFHDFYCESVRGFIYTVTCKREARYTFDVCPCIPFIFTHVVENINISFKAYHAWRYMIIAPLHNIDIAVED
jgi:hypothetical protein